MKAGIISLLEIFNEEHAQEIMVVIAIKLIQIPIRE